MEEINNDKSLEVINALLLAEKKLNEEVLTLRKRACEIAKEKRKIAKLLSNEDRQTAFQASLVEKQWSVKTKQTIEGFETVEDGALEGHLHRMENQ